MSDSVSTLKKWYSGQDFNAIYPNSLDSTISLWQQFLANQPLDSVQQRESEATFARPSIWEEMCPRQIKKEYLYWDEAQKWESRNQSLNRKKVLLKAFADSDSLWKPFFAQNLALIYVKENQTDSANIFLSDVPETSFLYTDLNALLNNVFVDSIFTKRQLHWRADSIRAAFYDLRYKEIIPSQLAAEHFPLALLLAEQTNQKSIVFPFDEVLAKHTLDFDFIRWYLSGVDWLCRIGEMEKAQLLLTRLEWGSTKPQNRFLIQEKYRFVQFLSGNQQESQE
jgi:hypothetical protein